MAGRKLDQRISEMIGLYQKDPEAFEKLRAELIRQTIEELPEKYRRRAYGLQFQVDMRLKKYRDPVMRMNAMITLFWDQFEEFQTVLNNPGGYLAARKERAAPGKVLPLKRPETLQ
jgi:hypothetical protein